MIARFKGLTYDSARRQVLDTDRQVLHLTPKAFELLSLLIERAPSVVTKAAIHGRLWAGVFVSDATLVGLVKELRRTVGDKIRCRQSSELPTGSGMRCAMSNTSPKTARKGRRTGSSTNTAGSCCTTGRTSSAATHVPTCG